MAEVDVTKDGPVLEVRFNRTDKRNALNNEMYLSVVEALRSLERDDELRVGLISGAGADFCAGNDIADFVAPRDEPLAASALLTLLPHVTKPLVAAVQGRAIGIGGTMLLHCDLVYVATDVDIRLPFVDLGVVPEAGSTLLLPRLVGRRRSAEVMLLGRPLDAERAVQWGMANAAVAPDELHATALEAARTLAVKPPRALAATKRLLRGDTAALDERVLEELSIFEELLGGAEFAAAAERFLHRR